MIPEYTATLDEGTGLWFFVTLHGKRYSGFKFQGACQKLADSIKLDDQRAIS